MINQNPAERTKKILVVEDNPELRRIMHLQLKNLGFDTILAANGKQALDLAASQLPDLITLDISLPDMDGLEAARGIRRNPETRSIPIIAVTARSLPEDRKRCIQGGCDEYISKPYTSSYLVSHIERLLASNSMTGLGPFQEPLP